jgi:hypothetical protein
MFCGREQNVAAQSRATFRAEPGHAKLIPTPIVALLSERSRTGTRTETIRRIGSGVL